MAQAVKQESITAADQLRNLLTMAEERVVAPSDGGGVRELFQWMDELADSWPQLDATGADLRGERTRWASLQSQVRRRGPQLVKAWQAQNRVAMAAARPPAQAQEPNWWWRLDAIVADEQRRKLRRGLLILLAGVAVVALLAFTLSRLFPVDPVVREAFRLRQNADEALRSEDYDAARDYFEQLVVVDPDDASAYVMLGVLAERRGDGAGADQAWSVARALQGDEASFLTLRGQAYLQVSEADLALADEQAALALNPDDPLTYFLLGIAHEYRGELGDAAAAYTTAGEMATESNPQLAVLARTRLANLLQGGGMQAPAESGP